jgi:hypothetical protein
MKLPFALLAGLISCPAGSRACMVCDTELGHQVQRGVFDGNFASTALAVLTPLPVLLLAGAIVHFAVPKLLAPKK